MELHVVERPANAFQYSVYLEYTDDLADSVPKWIQLEANGKDGFYLGKDLDNPEHADQLQRRQRGTP
ncbi:hypothetical protein [Streptomyces sp. NPDC023588]|uniref:hypothetical protein n=1 Tax=Streptomyces sp. NPDC023588 TaxID=3154907 RepID=UPI0033EA3AB6